MAIVSKSIKGNRYYYYQDSVKINNKNAVVTTYIGKSLKKINELSKQNPLERHFIKMFKANRLIDELNLHFENRPTFVDVNSLEFLKFNYNQFLDNLSDAEKEEFQNTLFIRYVYGTTVIEGNTLTEEEDEKLLAVGLTPKNKPLNESLEVANYNDIREFTEGYRGEVTEKFILLLHKLLMKGIRGQNGSLVNAGEYRTINVRIAGSSILPTPADQIEQRIGYLIKEHQGKLKRNVHPVEAASIFHQKFEEIHPFDDGNGRVGREILNYMLQKERFSPIYIPPRERSKYLDALDRGNNLEFVPLLDFIIHRMSATLVYLLSKTNLYDMIHSEEYKQYFVGIAGEQGYNSYIAEIEKLHEDKNNP
jgi:Fic family protein